MATNPLDYYQNLPGIMVDFQDGGLKIITNPNPPATESVLLLGTSIDGPLMEPVGVDAGSVETVFGSATRVNGLPNGTTLVKGFEQTNMAGCQDVRLMRITGAYATGQIQADAVTSTFNIPEDDQLGVAPGNAQVILPLNNTNIITGSVIVTANGVLLPSTTYTVDPGNALAATPTMGSVTLNANVTDSNASVYINYQYTDSSNNTITTSQNSYTDTNGQLVLYAATGQPTLLTLSATPVAGSLTLYANGVAVSLSGYTNTNNTITLQPGVVPLNAVLEATYSNTQVLVAQPTMSFQSFYAGALYNGVSYAVKDITNQLGQPVGKQVVIYKPTAKKAQVNEAPLTYSSLNYPSFQLLMNAINQDTNNNVLTVTVDNQWLLANPATLQNTPQTYLQGGDDGLSQTDQQMYEALSGVRDPSTGILTTLGAFQLLENYTVDHMVPLGVNADTQLAGKYDNFAYQLALACAVMSFRNHTTTGHIATSSVNQVGLQAINNQVNNLLAYNNNYFMRDLSGNILSDTNGTPIDLGRYIDVTAGPDIIFNSPRLGVYAEVSAAAVAGFISQLAPQSAPTNKAQTYAVGLRYQFSNGQLNSLTGARFITFKTKSNGTVVALTDGMTAAQPGSDYVRISTVQAVKEAINQLRDAAEPFLGESNETAQQNALSAAISKRLDLVKKNGVIKNYQFQIIASPQDQLLGQAEIELTIVPPQELRKLTVVVSLKPSL